MTIVKHEKLYVSRKSPIGNLAWIGRAPEAVGGEDLDAGVRRIFGET